MELVVWGEMLSELEHPVASVFLLFLYDLTQNTPTAPMHDWLSKADSNPIVRGKEVQFWWGHDHELITSNKAVMFYFNLISSCVLFLI